MAIYDNDGTVDYIMGKIYDNDGTTDYIICDDTAATPSLYIVTNKTSATTSTVTMPAGTYRLVYTSSCRSDGNPFSCIFDVYVNGSVKLTGSTAGSGTSYYSARYGTSTLTLTQESNVYIKAYCTVTGDGGGYYPHSCCALFKIS